MPELPEVETIRRGVEACARNRRITAIDVRNGQLRLPVPAAVQQACGQAIKTVTRRGKYLQLELERGKLLLHFGMSGSLGIKAADAPPAKHDHVDIVLNNGTLLRFNDPRRFGLLLWLGPGDAPHPLLARCGPEPLAKEFNGEYLWRHSRGKTTALKSFLMDARVVVGVGNIYAAEALFLAGLRPQRRAGQVSRVQYAALAAAIRQVLRSAIRHGGTTLRNYSRSNGLPGDFKQKLRVYGRKGLPCPNCGQPIRHRRIAGRSSCYCPRCQR